MDYELIIGEDGTRAIKCLVCGLTSYNPNDVENRYCGNCRAYYVTPLDVTIHILHHGQPLCGFSPKLPGNWPSGHQWVGKGESEYATCPGCKARMST